MKRTLILFFVLCGSIIAQAQCISKKSKGYVYHTATGDSTWSEYIYCIVVRDTTRNESPMSSIPEFNGDLNKWFSDSLNYPGEALDAHCTGTLYLSFAVGEDGAVSNLKILRGMAFCFHIDDEALRIASKMPKWKPGIRNHHKVQTNMVLSLRFMILWQNYNVSNKSMLIDSALHGKVH